MNVEAEWAEARRRAGLAPRPRSSSDGPVLSPYLCLHAGFFLGPGATLVSSLLIAPRALSIRRVAAMLGVAGAAWCLVQGLTVAVANSWAYTQVRVARIAINFLAGVALVLFWRYEAPSRFAHERRSIVWSLAMATGFVVGFWLLPSDWLLAMGR